MGNPQSEDPFIRLRVVVAMFSLFIALYPVHAAKDDTISTSVDYTWNAGTITAPIIIETVHTELNTVSDYGNGTCVPYARERTGIQIFGAAKTFISQATINGYKVSDVPVVGSIVVTNESYAGHVAVVEEVYDTQIVVSEQNYEGLYKITTRTIDKSNDLIVGYIYQKS